MVALDLAVVSPLQRRYLAQAGVIPLAAAEAYADAKAERAACEARCREQGITFEPVVAETYGGWGSGAQRTFKAIARAEALRFGQEEGATTQALFQRLSCSLLRSNAQAILDRLGGEDRDVSRRVVAAALRDANSLHATIAVERALGCPPLLSGPGGAVLTRSSIASIASTPCPLLDSPPPSPSSFLGMLVERA